jgi:DNA end-binding protein Ku
MSARPISTGNISFGLVSVPIKLYSGTHSRNVSFNMLHDKDKSRLRQQYVCQACGEVVGREATVKGYEYQKDQYVTLTEDEIKSLSQKTDQSISIEEFVPIEQVDPIHFEKSYLLGPDKGGGKAYRLLHDAMVKSGRVAVGRFSTRGKEQLVIIRPSQGGLMLHGLYYFDEVRSFDDVDFGDEPKMKPNEIDLAVQLIDQLTVEKFEASKFEDDYRKSVLAVIDRKVAGQEIVSAPSAAPREQIIDLVEALKRSLAAKQAQRDAASDADERKPAKAKGKVAEIKKAAAR